MSLTRLDIKHLSNILWLVLHVRDFDDGYKKPCWSHKKTDLRCCLFRCRASKETSS
jgi:hypothetical protein